MSIFHNNKSIAFYANIDAICENWEFLTLNTEKSLHQNSNDPWNYQLRTRGS